MNKSLTTFFALLVFLILTTSAFCDKYYVHAVNGLDSNDGLSADSPWKTITHAIKNVESDDDYFNPTEINIASGTYNITLGEEFPITMKDHVYLIGEDRESTIIDATGSEKQVMRCESLNGITIEGLTITGGSETNMVGDSQGGGGIYISESYPFIKNCAFTGNISNAGGAIYCYRSSFLRIQECIFEGNSAIRGFTHGGQGGSILSFVSDVIIEDCEFYENNAISGGAVYSCDSRFSLYDTIFEGNFALWTEENAGFGGAISAYESSFRIYGCDFKSNISAQGGAISVDYGTIWINNSNFERNSAYQEFSYHGNGGAIFIFHSSGDMERCLFNENESEAGGGIYCDYSSLDLERCKITNNIASFANGDAQGGGLCFIDSSPTINNCTIKGNTGDYGGGIYTVVESTPIITNCVISGNTANNYGGGIYSGSSSSATIINCLISNNYADNGGGVFSNLSSPNFSFCTIAGNRGLKGNGLYSLGADPTLINSILWDNGENQTEGNVSITYSNVEGGYEGEGNINADPIFSTGPWGDYYLSQRVSGQEIDSPCIDAGSEEPNSDFDQKSYITRTDGVLDSGRGDMGYHYIPHVYFELWMDNFNTGAFGDFGFGPRLDLITAPLTPKVDIYFIMQTPSGEYFSGMDWEKGVKPFVTSIALPAGLDIDDDLLFTFKPPCDKPPVSDTGTYTFYVGAVKPGTVDFISNIASSELVVN